MRIVEARPRAWCCATARCGFPWSALRPRWRSWFANRRASEDQPESSAQKLGDTARAPA